ncbi:unnamed protein product [Vitrella brassicaformis CCMP3155]|uniref:Transmembrane 9 superfamily member n=2 Tax=Vitrella brassicaformis TaxID=1169539 RepID=A0A0G4F2Q0_VITBC|nr:unnamed protein product [Vitrella brassicaformis CCMP3155]|mmetsp:Transcript_25902/g.64326  ORF Transcript_25902/g.64326 Transcript_25902/m.64326 type:complete len:625 (+) Transcript_25902:206-2080(+)|eukprot:CEM06493.1 unnamed protein product [Vitrella brassicaformis CCMP3155]
MLTTTRLSVALLVALGILTHLVDGWYLPGVAPRDYERGAPVKLKVNKLTSVKTQLPYKYYHLPFCTPEDIKNEAENLGEILQGDVIENSPYEIEMLMPVECKVLCKKDLKKKEKDLFKTMIDDEYYVNWIVDNLPAAMKYKAGDQTGYLAGFPVGQPLQGAYVLHNHVRMTFKYHSRSDTGGTEAARIVGFEVEPVSIEHPVSADETNPTYSCSGPTLNVEKADSVVFTYDVRWEPSPVKWASRWDMYLKMTDSQIHWFSIINSLMVVLFLSGMVAMILLRTLLRDIAKYNEMVDSLEEAQEESGWKLVHGDVFRRPPYYQMLAVCTGSGVQILGMTCVTLVFAALGLLSPAHRGGLLQAMLVLFTFMGFFAGYTAARFNNVMEGDDCERSHTVTLYTALLFPAVTFGIFFTLDLLIWGEQSSGAVPFSTMFLLLVLWFGISVPLVFMGSYFGYKKGPMSLPVRTNQIPRQIPPQHWLTHPLMTCLIGGVLPFGAVFTELFFIMSSMWQHQFYYLFGFLTLVLVILIITCAEISIAFTYFQLAGEDYRWWWRSFLSSACSAVYVFLYSVLYFYTRLNINKFVSVLLYFGYMTIISYSFFLLTGAIGFVATFFFVRAIYGSIKVD